GGVTEVREGVLVVHHPNALGSPKAGTVVDDGAALELQADLFLEPLFLSGDGPQFNGHSTGALRNSSGNNRYTAPLTLQASATIGVDSGNTLTLDSPGSLSGAAGFSLTKELTGTLVLAVGSPDLDGAVNVVQGVLRVRDKNALGSALQGPRCGTGPSSSSRGGSPWPGKASAFRARASSARAPRGAPGAATP